LVFQTEYAIINAPLLYSNIAQMAMSNTIKSLCDYDIIPLPMGEN